MPKVLRVLLFSAAGYACGSAPPRPDTDATAIQSPPVAPPTREETGREQGLGATVAPGEPVTHAAFEASEELQPSSLHQELYADAEVRVTASDTLCDVQWGRAQLTRSCNHAHVERHRLGPDVEVLHVVEAGEHSLVVNEAGAVRWLSVPWSPRAMYTHVRFPGDGSLRLGFEVHAPCRPSNEDMTRSRAGWPPAADIAGLRWTRGRLWEHSFVVTPEELTRASSGWHGDRGACELRANPQGEVRIGSRFLAGQDDWSRRVVSDSHGAMSMTASLPPDLNDEFYVTVAAGTLGSLIIEELTFAGSGTPPNLCEDGCTIQPGERRSFQVRTAEATRVMLRGRTAAPAEVTSEASMRLQEQQARTLYRDDPGSIRIRYALPNAPVGAAAGVEVWWDSHLADLVTPGISEHGPPDQAGAQQVRVGRRRLLYVWLSWSFEEDEGETEGYLLEYREHGLGVIPMALGVDRHSLVNPEFLSGHIRVPRSATRECVPSPREVQRSEREQGVGVGESADYFDAWVQRRSIDRLYEVSEDVVTPASTSWRWRGPWGRCEGWMLAACPFVDVTTDHGVVRVGEILRSVQFAPARQTLALPPSNLHNLPLEVRISEEKREVTYLDFIAVEVGGELRLPQSCGGQDPPAYCAADGDYERLEMGDSLTLRFEVEGEGAQLVAEGYYEPY